MNSTICLHVLKFTALRQSETGNSVWNRHFLKWVDYEHILHSIIHWYFNLPTIPAFNKKMFSVKQEKMWSLTWWQV
jgi:hypothetical protein